MKRTIRKFRIVQTEGKREVNRDRDRDRDVNFYNFDAIISVGYRVNSVRTTQFRQWAVLTFREYAIKGYVLDTIGIFCSFLHSLCSFALFILQATKKHRLCKHISAIVIVPNDIVTIKPIIK